LTRTLQSFEWGYSTYSPWMLGRTFKALRKFRMVHFESWNPSRHEGLQVDLPACTILELDDCPMSYLRFLSCSNVQKFRWLQSPGPLYKNPAPFDLAAFNSLRDFLSTLSCLKTLYIFLYEGLGRDSMTHFVFCGALEKGVWRDIRSVEVKAVFDSSSEASDFVDQTHGQRRYEKWWKTFTTKRDQSRVTLNASM